ncbi:lactose-binding lectin l-2-like [Hemibagrus wyckioides]|uniref:lactose-binding lectin l-2-like n=1 Tax=Hemibagrus wyckioides TaxID=337641 RepID=UPI00266C024C|nr:lactose-binding lectin l-2-like [Hemibagrus wyckioides]
MACQTKVVMLLILATVALDNVVNTLSAADFDDLVKAAKHQVKSRGYSSCPFGWVKYGRRCFTYQAHSLDWASAEIHCLNRGGHLVSIHSEDEYQLVKALIRAHDHDENPTWIGLNGCQKTYNFFWSDGTKLTFTKWNPYEPNAISGECCVHINWPGSKNWNDIPCDRSYPYVCAKKIH